MKSIFFIFLFSSVWVIAQPRVSPKLAAHFADVSRKNGQLRIIATALNALPADSLRRHFSAHNTTLPLRAKTVHNILKRLHDSDLNSLQYWIIRYAPRLRISDSWYAANTFEIVGTVVELSAVQHCPLLSDVFLAGEYAMQAARPVVELPDAGARGPGYAEPGLRAIGADKLWALGLTGKGRTALIMDSGIWPNHPAIKRNFKGNYQPLHVSWYGFDQILPADKSSSHGTHVIGTVMGLDAQTRDTLGAAFDAYFIAADPIVGNAADIKPLGVIMRAFEWALNPDGDTNTWKDVPDVVNNSWGHLFDSAEVVCRSPFARTVEALQVAGCAVVWSAGNEGPGTKTIGSPATITVNPYLIFTVGAINAGNTSFPLASFSSRGPSWCVDTGRLAIKPEVVAPGVNVRSAVGQNSYAIYSGTSMASPHVSGVVLQLKQAFPHIAGEEILDALYLTARDLGNQGEDNLYGNGIIRADSAFYYLLKSHVPRLLSDSVSLQAERFTSSDSGYFCDDHAIYNWRLNNSGLVTLNNLYTDVYVNGKFNKRITVAAQLNPTASLLISDTINILESGSFIAEGLTDVSVRSGHDALLSEQDTVNNAVNFRYNFRNRNYPQVPAILTTKDILRDWYIENPDGDFTWQYKEINGQQLLLLEIFRNNVRGKTDALITPVLPTYPIAAYGQGDAIELEMAYRNKAGNVFRDSIFVYTSRDCGQLWTEVYRNNLNVLQGNMPDTGIYFIPRQNDWRILSIPATHSGAMVRIAIKSDFGNNVYLRSARFLYDLVARTQEHPTHSFLMLYPNPASTHFFVSDVKLGAVLRIFNATGMEVARHIIENKELQNGVPCAQLLQGIYIVETEGRLAKMLIQH